MFSRFFLIHQNLLKEKTWSLILTVIDGKQDPQINQGEEKKHFHCFLALHKLFHYIFFMPSWSFYCSKRFFLNTFFKFFGKVFSSFRARIQKNWPTLRGVENRVASPSISPSIANSARPKQIYLFLILPFLF